MIIDRPTQHTAKSHLASIAVREGQGVCECNKMLMPMALSMKH